MIPETSVNQCDDGCLLRMDVVVRVGKWRKRKQEKCEAVARERRQGFAATATSDSASAVVSDRIESRHVQY